MNAATILRDLEQKGFCLRATAASDGIVVRPFSRLTTDERNLIRTHKAAIIAALTVGEIRDRYEERAALGEFDHGLSRPEAEHRAWESAITMYLNACPGAAQNAANCPACQRRLGDDAVPLLRPGGGHTLVHARCTARYLAERRAAAAKVLVAAGIPQPPDWRP